MIPSRYICTKGKEDSLTGTEKIGDKIQLFYTLQKLSVQINKIQAASVKF